MPHYNTFITLNCQLIDLAFIIYNTIYQYSQHQGYIQQVLAEEKKYEKNLVLFLFKYIYIYRLTPHKLIVQNSQSNVSITVVYERVLLDYQLRS